MQETGRQGSGWANAEVSCQPPLLRGPALDGEGWQAPRFSQGSRALAPSPSACEKTPARHLLPSERSALLQGTHRAGLAVRCNLGKEAERERVRSWGRGRGRAGEGCRGAAEEAGRGAQVTVDVEAVLVQAVGAQLRDASGLVAHFAVKAHPVQGWGGGLLPVGADGVHARVVPLPHWPAKHSAVPEHPSSAPSRCTARPWGFRSRLGAGTQALRSQAVRAWWPATALLPPLTPWGC